MAYLPELLDLPMKSALALYDDLIRDNDQRGLRDLMLNDLFGLLVVGCRRVDMLHPFIYERCREVQRSPDGHMDLWSREHYKSTVITFGMTIFDLLRDPERTFGIFSHTRPVAKKFLQQIKLELEQNGLLKDLFPDVLYREPHKQSPSWSLDGGLIVQRDTNPKEKSVEAWGLVDGQPIGAHFKVLVYDDVVTRESVTTPEQIQKTNEAWGLSLSLGAIGGKKRHIGTKYRFNDTWSFIEKSGAVKTRKHPATVDGTANGDPVLMDPETLAERRRSGPYIFACQYLLDPVAEEAQGFREEWLRYYDQIRPGEMNLYLFVDPAGEKKKDNDYTVMWLIGTAPDGNYYAVDGIRARMNLAERTREVFRFVRKYRPVKVVYEKYGMQSDIEHILYVQEQENYRFSVQPIGGQTPKLDRIRRLVPIFEAGRMFFPHRLVFVEPDGTAKDLIQLLLDEEYSTFPVSEHDDMLDSLSRCVDSQAGVTFPKPSSGPVLTHAVSDYEVL